MNNRDSSRQLKRSLPLLVTLTLCTPALSLASIGQGKPADGHNHSEPAEEYKEITVKGRVACLDASTRRLVAAGDCDLQKKRLGFLASDGKLFTFWSEDTAGAMLADPRVSKYQLQLTARVHLRDQLETIRVQALREGTLYELFYFCHVCNITAYAPGPCPCCYQELEFIERPATERGSLRGFHMGGNR